MNVGSMNEPQWKARMRLTWQNSVLRCASRVAGAQFRSMTTCCRVRFTGVRAPIPSLEPKGREAHKRRRGFSHLIVVMKSHATEAEIQAVARMVEDLDYNAHIIRGV